MSAGPDWHHARAASGAADESLLQPLLENALVGIFLIRDGRIIRANRTLAELTGYSREDLAAMSGFLEVVVEDERSRVAEHHRRRTAGLEPESRYFTRIRRKDGTVVEVEVQAALTEVEGRPAVVGTMLDVTEQRRAAAALRESEALHQSVVESLPLALFRKDREGRYVFVNGRFCEAMGRPLEAIVGRTDYDLSPHELADKYRRDDRRVLENQQVFEDVEPHHRPDGSRYWIQIVKSPVFNARSEVVGVQGVFWDVTDRRRAEEELRRANARLAETEKMRALGQMAAGIAHDFNNALAGILGFAELLQQRSDLPDEARQWLGKIRTAAEDAGTVVRRMQSFARADADDDRRPVDLNELVTEVVELTRPRWSDEARRRGASIDVSFARGEAPTVSANPAELRAVLTNLMLNAVQALPAGGRIDLTTGRQGKTAFVCVRDNGVGMDEDTRSRCFEPFFTTKGVEGTGMGLAVCWAVARRHGGGISVESEPGRGSAFTLWLPVPAVGAGRAPAAAEPAGPTTGAPPGPLAVLVADDHPAVLSAVESLVRILGHDVTAARGGREAIDQLRARRFDVVITDLGMPDLDGRAVAQAAKDADPGLRVILLTGWGAELNAAGERPDGVDLVLAKPVTLDRLRASLSGVRR
jgi:PAS domain S-box-containing protein